MNKLLHLNAIMLIYHENIITFYTFLPGSKNNML